MKPDNHNVSYLCPFNITEKLQKNDWILLFNSCSGEVSSIQYYVIKSVSDLRQVGGFLRVLRFPPPIKLTNPDIVKLALTYKIKLHHNTII